MTLRLPSPDSVDHTLGYFFRWAMGAATVAILSSVALLILSAAWWVLSRS